MIVEDPIPLRQIQIVIHHRIVYLHYGILQHC